MQHTTLRTQIVQSIHSYTECVILTFVRRLFKFCVTERVESRLRVHPILDLP